MELRELRTFWTTVRLRSMTGAAEALGISQPTVSVHIRQLEKELGVVLLNRVIRPIEVTSDGAALCDVVAPILERLDNLVPWVNESLNESSVRIASTHDIITHTLLRVVDNFVSKHPHVSVRIRSGTRLNVLNLVSEGIADIGIVPGPERRIDLDFQALFGYELVLIAPLGHPLLQSPLDSIDQIAGWPLILMGPGTYTRAMLEEEFTRRGITYDIVVELDSMDMIKRYVTMGIGISIGPRIAIEQADERYLGISSLASLLPVEQAGFVTLRGKSIAPAVQDFITVMKDTLSSIL